MRQIEAYQAADGSLHVDEKSAVARDTDMLGEELDGFLRFYGLELSRAQEHKACLSALNRRADILIACRKMVSVLEHSIYSED